MVSVPPGPANDSDYTESLAWEFFVAASVNIARLLDLENTYRVPTSRSCDARNKRGWSYTTETSKRNAMAAREDLVNSEETKKE